MPNTTEQKAEKKYGKMEELQKKLKGKEPKYGRQAKAIRRIKHLLKKKLRRK